MGASAKCGCGLWKEKISIAWAPKFQEPNLHAIACPLDIQVTIPIYDNLTKYVII